MIVVRAATEDDLPAVVALCRAIPHLPQWTHDQFAGMLLSSPQIARVLLLAALPGGQVVGFAAVHAVLALQPAEGEIETVAVAAPHREQGIGAALLTAAIHWATDHHCGLLRLEVRRSNAAALALYRAGGFAVAGQRLRYYTDPVEDALLLERTLPLPRPEAAARHPVSSY